MGFKHPWAQLAQGTEKSDPGRDDPGLGLYGKVPMRKQLFAAMLALAATPGLAPGGDESSTPPAFLPTPVPASQAASPPSSVSEESAPRPVFAFDSSTQGTNPGEPCATAEGASGPPSSFWVRGEYLLWWIKDSQAPALITTGVPGATALPGVLGQPGTTVLFGGSDVDNQVRSGGRVTGGFWLDNCQTVGLEGNYFFLGSRSVRFDRASSGAPGEVDPIV